MTDVVGSLLAGRYQLRRHLSVSSSMRGTNGDQLTEPSVSSTAWEAEDTALDRKVFVKLLSGDTPPEIVDAHLALWERLRQISLGGIPDLLFHGVDDGRSFVVTEWVNAMTLEDAERRIRSDRLDADQIENITVRALQALASLHDAGIVHGDISPSNILVSEALVIV